MRLIKLLREIDGERDDVWINPEHVTEVTSRGLTAATVWTTNGYYEIAMPVEDVLNALEGNNPDRQTVIANLLVRSGYVASSSQAHMVAADIMEVLR
jgi:hypothetical protein